MLIASNNTRWCLSDQENVAVSMYLLLVFSVFCSRANLPLGKFRISETFNLFPVEDVEILNKVFKSWNIANKFALLAIERLLYWPSEENVKVASELQKMIAWKYKFNTWILPQNPSSGTGLVQVHCLYIHAHTLVQHLIHENISEERYQAFL